MRNDAKNIVLEKPGPICVVRDCKTPLDIFSLFMPPSSLTKITDYTNQKMEKIKEQYRSTYVASETTNTEIMAVLGILVISGTQ